MPCRIERGTFQNVSDGDGCLEKPGEYVVHAASITDRNVSISVGGIGCSIDLVGCLKTNKGDNNTRKKFLYAFKYPLLQYFYLCSDRI